MHGVRKVFLAALIGGLLTLPVIRAQPQGPAREIIPLTGDLYRARNANWYTIFLVTPDGIILGDPINPPFAGWLKGELGRRWANFERLRRMNVEAAYFNLTRYR